MLRSPPSGAKEHQQFLYMSDPRKNFRQRIWDLLRQPGKPGPHSHEEVRARLWGIIDQGKGHLGKACNSLIFWLIIISLVILPLELLPTLEQFHLFAEIIEITVTAIFTVEYAVRIYAAPKRLHYIFSWWGVIDLLAILPYYISLAKVNSEIFRFVRLARVVRILKVAQIKSSEELEKEIQRESHGKLQLGSDEVIERVVIKHPLFLVIGLILPLVLGTVALLIIVLGNFHQIAITIGAVLGLFMLIFLYKAWLDYHYDVLYITNQRIIFQDTHLFGRTHNQVEYADISNVRPTHTGFWSYILGFGSIIIETASDQSLIEHRHVKKHEEVARCIHEKCRYHRKQDQPQESVAAAEAKIAAEKERAVEFDSDFK